jgi:hypothetical protein
MPVRLLRNDRHATGQFRAGQADNVGVVEHDPPARRRSVPASTRSSVSCPSRSAEDAGEAVARDLSDTPRSTGFAARTTRT